MRDWIVDTVWLGQGDQDKTLKKHQNLRRVRDVMVVRRQLR